MDKVIVTGASGFIGTALMKRLLSEGYQVYAVIRNPGKISVKHDNLTIIKADITDYAALDQLISDRDFDTFFHVAWDGVSRDSYQDYYKQLKNTACSADALMSAVKLKAKKFIFVSSIVALEAKHYMIVDDGSPRAATIYGAAKSAAEAICKTLAFHHGMSFNTAVIASAYGEGDRSEMVQNTVIRALQRGECPKLADGEKLYDWIYIDDIVPALIMISKKGKAGRTYYVGHRELQTFEYLVSKTRDIIAPDIVLKFGTLTDATVTDYSLIDREALFLDTGFECQTDFTESIIKTAAWLRFIDQEQMKKWEKL